MNQPLLECKQVGKAFFGTPVLRDVCFSLPSGSVLGVVGENGAGKSTLMNILGGILPADAGEILLAGKTYAPRHAREAREAGIALVHQELNLFANLSIAENLFLADFPSKRRVASGWLDRKTMRQKAQSLLAAVRLDLDPRTRVERLSPGQCQLVEIAKALHGKPRIVILDEPTTSLTRQESEHLFAILGNLRQSGVSIICISHNLTDVLRLSDRIVVLRDGQVQAIGSAEQFDVDRMIRLMIGRSLEALFPSRSPPATSKVVLEVRGLSQSNVVEDIDFTLSSGEILGISGLMGSGRTELARILFGLAPYQRGEIRLHGIPLRPSPRECIRRGMAFLTEDRRQEGLLLDANIVENIGLVALPQFALRPFGWLTGGKLLERVSGLAASLSLSFQHLQRQRVRTLSGGNQQKVVLAKWLLRGSDLLLLDEPTRGVDIGARQEIYRQIDRLSAAGAGVLMISSEMEELMGLCDRILVMAGGRIQSIVQRDQFDRHAMLQSAFGEGGLS